MSRVTIGNCSPVQELRREWYGREIVPPVQFSFTLENGNLVFTARQARAVNIHPTAKPGEFTENLWKYDTAEFFVANADATRYLEFNLCPNGAWWACVFTAPRVKDESAPPLPAVQTRGSIQDDGSWECRAELPIAYLEALGMPPARCRLAAAAIQNSPDYTYLTTSDDQSGEPDFHRPSSWPLACIL